ncbi:hypothetical protein G7Z17_g5723 [Cylindrodendrum hubeiense]|uniref:Uncharacterized protein n=1 Tax=Cylindrodendrum hubeiense TaxID=595255 RepID=A0A9P5HBD4_9HYPO|nr:hypothetical protein G7Z17_g5723 [Cylindrodendrum hubeiense]
MGLVHHGLDLFNYDQRVCSSQVLIPKDGTPSNIEYDEYVVYKKPEDSAPEAAHDSLGDKDEHVAHHFTRDDASGTTLFDLAFRHGFLLDRNGEFRKPDGTESPSSRMEGRIRRVTPADGGRDILSMTVGDLAAMNLHPATLQYSTRTTTESRFWSKDRSELSEYMGSELLLVARADRYSRSATILVRQSWEPRRHNLDDLDEYDHRLESCRAHWAHPLIMPVVLLQVQFMRCEEAVSDNNMNVAALEHDVSNIAGFDTEEPSPFRLRRQLSRDENGKVTWGPMTMANLMKRAHEVLKDTIKLLDTIRWMERAVKVLILAGDELAERMGSSPQFGQDLSMLSPMLLDPERGPPPVSPVLPPRFRIQVPEGEMDGDSLGSHWHEIRQYLDGLLRLCMGLETDRRMSEARCRAQIDMIYSKMAQEDNVLNARMAVASSRDSSAMKALAVITAIFLPGEFLSSLWGMSMFDWLGPDEEDDPGAKAGTGNVKRFSQNFWIFWATVIPLTVFILVFWRAWWVVQDRYFRRHLSQELSEERFWTADGKPRTLDKSFVHDFFYLSARRDEKARVKEDMSDLEAVDSTMKDGDENGLGRSIRRDAIILGVCGVPIDQADPFRGHGCLISNFCAFNYALRHVGARQTWLSVASEESLLWFIAQSPAMPLGFLHDDSDNYSKAVFNGDLVQRRELTPFTTCESASIIPALISEIRGACALAKQFSPPRQVVLLLFAHGYYGVEFYLDYSKPRGHPGRTLTMALLRSSLDPDLSVTLITPAFMSSGWDFYPDVNKIPSHVVESGTYGMDEIPSLSHFNNQLLDSVPEPISTFPTTPNLDDSMPEEETPDSLRQTPVTPN